MIKKILTKDKALDKLASLCSRSEQCESDLIRKLINWGVTSSERNDIIKYLKENRYIDESRYAKSFVNDKAKFSCWGPYKIRLELAKRKISRIMVDEAIKNVEKSIWKESILKCAKAKARNMDLVGEGARENRQKLLRYLVSRGFPTGISSKVVIFMKQSQEETDDKEMA